MKLIFYIFIATLLTFTLSQLFHSFALTEAVSMKNGRLLKEGKIDGWHF